MYMFKDLKHIPLNIRTKIKIFNIYKHIIFIIFIILINIIEEYYYIYVKHQNTRIC
jgi:hypothetical protein